MLGERTGLGAIGHRPMAVGSDGQGRVFVLASEVGAPLVFRADGRFLQRLGAVGTDSGEYTWVSAFTSAGGRAAVFDNVNRRLTILSLDDLTSQSEASMPGFSVGALLLLNDSVLVLNSGANMPEGIGFPLQLVRAKVGAPGLGTPLRWFGADDQPYAQSTAHRSRRRLARSTSGGFWAAHGYDYVVEFWSEEGELVRRLERRPPWFLGESGPSLGTPWNPPFPRIMSILEDSAGLLWIMALVPDPQWREAWRGITVVEGVELEFGPADVHLFDTAIDILDPASGTLVFSASLDAAGFGFLGDGVIAAYGGTPQQPLVEVWQLTLKGW
ncbi:MAG TPA: hypothetical protein VGA70_07305 [Longimicrobiales bacterium]|jgi:hypothetical protein